jgi:DNA-binding MarR family transcriptional regulator
MTDRTTAASAAQRGKRLRLDDYLPYRLTVATGWVTRLISRIYEDRFGLNITQWRVIALLGDEGKMTQQQIAQRSTMDKIAAHRAAASLLARDIVRVSETIGGRFKFLELTTQGRKIHAEIAPLALDLERQVFERAGLADPARFHETLKNVEFAAREMYDAMMNGIGETRGED